MNGNGYEYVQVDPKVIQMLGGDDAAPDLSGDEFGADLPNSVLESYSTPKKPKNFKEDFYPKFPNMPETTGQDSVSALLQEILNELREIKTIIAGR